MGATTTTTSMGYQQQHQHQHQPYHGSGGKTILPGGLGGEGGGAGLNREVMRRALVNLATREDFIQMFLEEITRQL